MTNNKKTKKIKGLDYVLITDFFITAYEDYLAARLLLLNNLLSQGCIFANTSIEKYFKAFMLIAKHEIPRHHDISISKYYNTLNNKFPKIAKVTNRDFLKFLSESYRLRYFDELEINYNLIIIRLKTLAELDFYVHSIEESFDFHDDRQPVNRMRKYRSDKEKKNPVLFLHNHIFSDINKDNYIQQPDYVYEFRKLTNGQIVQVYYTTNAVKNDGQFIYEAFKPNPENNLQFSTVFPMIQQGESNQENNNGK